MIFLKAAVYTIVVFLLFYLAQRNRDSKKIYNVIMAFCWIVIALSMESHDLSNYRWAYDAKVLIGKDKLFDFLQTVFSSCGVHFSLFKVLYGTVIWLLLYRGLRHYTKDVALLAGFFALSAMMGYGTQLRSSMAGAIVLNAIPFLTDEKKGIWKYCLMVGLATMFHFMAIFYLVFLLPKWIPIPAKKFRNYMCCAAVILIPFFWVFTTPIYNLLVYLQTVVETPVINTILVRLAQYFSGQMSPNIKGFLFSAGGHIVTFVLTDRMCNAMLKLREQNTGAYDSSLLLSSYTIEYLYKLSSILVLFVPCYMLSMQFDRFPGYFTPVNYCLIVQGARELRLVRNQNYNSIRKIITDLPKWNGSLLNWVRDVLEQYAGVIDILVLFACITFCFLVANWYSGYGEFSRIINGIGMFDAPTP